MLFSKDIQKNKATEDLETFLEKLNENDQASRIDVKYSQSFTLENMDHAVAININDFGVHGSTITLSNEVTCLCMFFCHKICERMFIEFPPALWENF